MRPEDPGPAERPRPGPTRELAIIARRADNPPSRLSSPASGPGAPGGVVVDASAAVLAMLNDGEARAQLSRQAVVTPHLADSEIRHALRSRVLRGQIDEPAAARADGGVSGMIDRMWELEVISVPATRPASPWPARGRTGSSVHDHVVRG